MGATSAWWRPWARNWGRNCAEARVEEDIPRKAYYTIGEVSRITGVQAHVLRYWENQGKILKPGRKRSRHRLYRPADIQLIFEIKRLREEEKLTLPAMRRQLNPQTAARLPTPPAPPAAWENEAVRLLRAIRDELLELRELLE
ncbi:MAG: MerR family transcriptional regulator [Deltaproteobacteria bacterium]|nr:MerR family transcriptional regulator [Deltaproteobacteria bacterium]